VLVAALSLAWPASLLALAMMPSACSNHWLWPQESTGCTCNGDMQSRSGCLVCMVWCAQLLHLDLVDCHASDAPHCAVVHPCRRARRCVAAAVWAVMKSAMAIGCFALVLEHTVPKKDTWDDYVQTFPSEFACFAVTSLATHFVVYGGLNIALALAAPLLEPYRLQTGSSPPELLWSCAKIIALNRCGEVYFVSFELGCPSRHVLVLACVCVCVCVCNCVRVSAARACARACITVHVHVRA
jgi:hypothetical protein